jgi:signal transduction histidine kinase
MTVMGPEDKVLADIIADEFEQAVFVLNPANNVVLANDSAKTKLGIIPGCGEADVAGVFGVENLYLKITTESFNYQWHGNLPFSQPDGTVGVLNVKAKYVPGEMDVFHNILIIGNVSNNSDFCLNNGSGINHEQAHKLYEISATINSNLDFQSICSDITMKAAELVGADRSLLYSVEDTQIGVFAAWNMTPEEKALFRLVDMEHGVIKNCLRNMAPVLVPYYSRHPDWIPEIYQALGQFESFILFPLLAQKQLVGVLALFGTRPGKFDDKTLMLLQMISSQMAIAVLNAQVYSEISNLNKHLEEEVCLKVSELRISELQLIRKSNEQEAVFNSITDILVVVDRNLRIININEAAVSYFHIKEKRRVLAKKFCDIICQRRHCRRGDNECCYSDFGGDNCDKCMVMDTIRDGRPNIAEIDIADRVHMTSIYPIFDEAGKVDKAVCFFRDITLLKRRSGELVQSQKMQAVGQLAAGVAHEIRNPLGAISNYVYILENWLHDIESGGFTVEDDIRHSLMAIRKLVERSEHVIRGLLDFSREKSNELSLLDFRDVLSQVMLLVGKTAQKKKVEIATAGDPGIKIRSNSNALQHIIFNLLVNAIDALPTGGRVSLSFGLVNSMLLLTVVDNGEGIKKEDLDKIYNPFYTTKAPDKGTGLGLYIVYNLVKQLGGGIAVESSPGLETRFTVTLPQ